MILTPLKIVNAPLLLSAVVVDTLDAERLLILNRQTGEKLAHFKIADGITARILPAEYALEANLSVVMFDDNAEFGAAIADNVQAMPINIFTFNPANPQQYEPAP